MFSKKLKGLNAVQLTKSSKNCGAWVFADRFAFRGSLLTFGVIVTQAIGSIDDTFEVVSNIVNPVNHIISDDVHKVDSLWSCTGSPGFNRTSEESNPTLDVISDSVNVSFENVYWPPREVLLCLDKNLFDVVNNLDSQALERFTGFLLPVECIGCDLNGQVTSRVSDSRGPPPAPPAVVLLLSKAIAFKLRMELWLLHELFGHGFLSRGRNSLDVQVFEVVHLFSQVIELWESKISLRGDCILMCSNGDCFTDGAESSKSGDSVEKFHLLSIVFCLVKEWHTHSLIYRLIYMTWCNRIKTKFKYIR